MATTQDLRTGMTIRYNGELYQVIEYQHINPGNWRAFVRIKIKSMKTGRTLEDRLRAGETIETVHTEHRPMQFLYKDGNDFHFMDTETYDQIQVNGELIGQNADLLRDNDMVDVHFAEDNPIGVDLPTFVQLAITYTEPGVRGDTATNVLKQATLETGAVINVPIFVNQDDIIKVDTRTRSYIERVR